MILDLFLLRVFYAPSYCSFMFIFMAICGHFKFIYPSAVPIIPVMLILLFLIGVVQLAPQQEVASRTHRSTVNWIFTVFSLIIDYWIDNGIYSAFIVIIINLII